MKAVTSELLKKIPGLKHGFGTIEEPIPSALDPFWSSAHPSWKQVHGTNWVEVRSPHQKCGETDALISFSRGLPVAVVTADCVPVLLARRSGGAVAAIHAGWRGTYNGTVDRVLEELVSRGENLKDWVAAIGPSIRACCYEVSEELIGDFKNRFTEVSPKQIEPSFRKLDLQEIHETRLRRAGLAEVETIQMCTFCSGGFHSFRREKNSNRQYSGLVSQP